MDPNVAGGAVAVLGVEHVVGCRLLDDAGFLPAESTRAVMALEAHGKEHRTGQKPGVHGAVRHVAGLAAFHVHGDRLECKRPPLTPLAFPPTFFLTPPL